MTPAWHNIWITFQFSIRGSCVQHMYNLSIRSKLCNQGSSQGTGRLASQGSNFSWTKSGLSSWGQCPTPFSKKRFTLGSWAGKDEKYLPTGPLIGVKGSSSPHSTNTGNWIFGINWIGFGPGGPVTIETKASRAPSSSAGFLIICNFSKRNMECLSLEN